MNLRKTGVVTAIESARPGAQEIAVALADELGETISDHAETRRALVLTELTGQVAIGERVLLNIVAVELRLGTGGLDFVVARLDAPTADEAPPGHILKLRYTPLQTPVLAVEAPESPHHEAVANFVSLDDLPVVCLELHSQLPAVCAGARWALNECGWNRLPRIVYIMTEGAALPLALSRLVAQCKANGLITATITCGQAFGGDYEAVNMYSALAAAQNVCEADLVVVGQGPGNVGTETPLGFSGLEQGLAINAVASLGGIAVVVPRISFADPRSRHNGLSHHTVTILTRIARAPALVAVPRLPSPYREILSAALDESKIAETHETVTIDAAPALNALQALGLRVTTMGRELNDERAFFLAACAGGILAAQLADVRTT